MKKIQRFAKMTRLKKINTLDKYNRISSHKIEFKGKSNYLQQTAFFTLYTYSQQTSVRLAAWPKLLQTSSPWPPPQPTRVTPSGTPEGKLLRTCTSMSRKGRESWKNWTNCIWCTSCSNELNQLKTFEGKYKINFWANSKFRTTFSHGNLWIF